MSNSDSPWEPPIAGTETEQLLGALERQRATFRWKTDDLDEAQLNKRIGASGLTLASLLKHLAWVEASGFNKRLTGDPYGPPWDDVDFRADPDWEFRTAADDSPQTLYALWDDAVNRSRERLGAFLAANGDLGQPVHLSWPDGTHASLRRLLFDLLEEYARHTGHADLLREAIDGRTGEDPPPGWRPVSGRFRFASEAD